MMEVAMREEVQYEAKQVLEIRVPEGLNCESKRLIMAFAEQMAFKLRAFEVHKSGNDPDGWKTNSWSLTLRAELAEQLRSNDPVGAANYLAMAWSRHYSIRPNMVRM
jgi:hypothetical protein